VRAASSSARTPSRIGSCSNSSIVAIAAAHAAGSHDHVDERAHRALRAEDGADRHDAAAHRLAQAHQVRIHAPPVDREHRPGPSESRLDLVDAEQPLVLAAEVDERRPERIGRCHASTRAHHGFDEHAGDLARVDGVEDQVIPNVVDGPVTGPAGPSGERRSVRVGIRDVDESRHQRAVAERQVRRLRADGAGRPRLAVVPAHEPDHDRPAGGAPHEPDRRLDGLRPVQGDVNARKPVRRDPEQRLRER
jgi:hypothetical protein